MTADTEAAADVLTGGVVASAVEPKTGTPPYAPPETAVCLNCGGALTGAFCASCGQAAHLHRTIVGLGHDILHSVFHFEGKLWRTLPELVINPGRLTRRYVHGERAKFVSPIALYLFTVFLMYAVFSVTGSPLGAADWKEITANAAREAQVEPASNVGQATPADTPKQIPEGQWGPVLKGLTANPELVAYKLKVNGYKYSWALIPLSLPFMWLLFIRRRDVHVYDHAIFVTYSITFMMWLMVIVEGLGGLLLPSRWLSPIMQVGAVVHMYRQLRGAYTLSVVGALLRVIPLLLSAAIVLSLFVTLLISLGLLG